MGSGIPTDPAERLQYDIDQALADSIFRSTVPSLKVYAPASGEVLFERNSSLYVRPASNMKLMTSATALHVLGPRYIFKTSVAFDSLDVEGTVHGNIYLKGYGNPDLTTADLDTLAIRTAMLGVRRVTGSVMADDSYFDSLSWGAGWMWDDEPAPYQAYVSALSVNKNCVIVTVAPDSITGTGILVSTNPETRYITVVNRSSVARDTVLRRISISRPASEAPNTIVVEGEMRVGSRPHEEQITILWPELYAATLFTESLEHQGIRVYAPPIRGRHPAGVVERAWHTWGIDSVVTNLNKVSDNLSAEMLLKTVSATRSGPPGRSRDGVHGVNQFLATLGIDTLHHWMADGSGLSHYSLLRADLLVELLSAMCRQTDIFPLYYSSLPIGGVDGTLENRMRGTPAEGRVHAKTGSIAGVSSLSGYVLTSDNEILVFGMTMQDFILPTRYYRNIQDRICTILAGFSRGTPQRTYAP